MDPAVNNALFNGYCPICRLEAQSSTLGPVLVDLLRKYCRMLGTL